jgi:hydroxymethylpyrimidine pyrophosphatase-like HAD family hydrolase
MLLAALAFDYDGTIAHDGRVDEATVEALRRMRASGRKVLLVTGRELPELKIAFSELDIFDVIVAENGALIYLPALAEERPLAPPPPPAFIAALRDRGVAPLSIGRSIVATWHPNESKVLEAIQEVGLEWQIIFNKGAVMCLPSGVNKASGLAAALDFLSLSPLNVAAVGDAENDHAFLTACGCAVAVANAIETIKAEADIVTAGARGAGVVELIGRLLDGDEATAHIRRHDILLGEGDEGPVHLKPEASVLVAGSSGIGKSRLATMLIEHMQALGFQVCVIDPEGDYQGLEKTISLGDTDRAPLEQEALDVLSKPAASVVVNMLGIELKDRPGFFCKLLGSLGEMRAKLGRPHWIVIDEAHHLIPAESPSPDISLPKQLPGTLLITAEPERLSKAALEATDAIIAVGAKAPRVIAAYCKALGVKAPKAVRAPGDDEVLFWRRGAGAPPRIVRIKGPAREHRRHVRKYAQGTLGEDKSFYFQGPKGALNLRAQNLMVFLQMAEGVDDETWLFHLRRKDYSRWFREAIADDDLAQEAERVETADSDAATSRAQISEIVRRRYTAPAEA